MRKTNPIQGKLGWGFLFGEIMNITEARREVRKELREGGAENLKNILLGDVRDIMVEEGMAYNMDGTALGIWIEREAQKRV